MFAEETVTLRREAVHALLAGSLDEAMSLELRTLRDMQPEATHVKMPRGAVVTLLRTVTTRVNSGLMPLTPELGATLLEVCDTTGIQMLVVPAGPDGWEEATRDLG